MRPGLVILLLLLPLAGCAIPTPVPEGCAANVLCAARRAEPLHLSPGRAERKGDELILFSTQGGERRFQDHLQACETVAENCVGFALMDISLPAQAFVVQQFYYEGSDILLIDSRSGRSTPLHGVPVFSPDGREFLVAPYDDESDVGPNNLEIWRREGDGAVLEWAHPFRQAYAEDPGLKQLYETRVLAWRGNHINLALREPGTERRWTGSITRDGAGWHLSAVSPH